MQILKSVDLIGHGKFLPWQQLNGQQCDQTLPLSAKGAACKTKLVSNHSLLTSPSPLLHGLLISELHFCTSASPFLYQALLLQLVLTMQEGGGAGKK